MSDENRKINISGSTFLGGITNIGGTQAFNQSINVAMSNLSATISGMNTTQDEKSALQGLIVELETALKQAPTEKQADAERIARRAREAIEEAAAEKPDQEVVEVKANLLRKAAENIAGTIPTVVPITVNIVARLLKIGL